MIEIKPGDRYKVNSSFFAVPDGEVHPTLKISRGEKVEFVGSYTDSAGDWLTFKILDGVNEGKKVHARREFWKKQYLQIECSHEWKQASGPAVTMLMKGYTGKRMFYCTNEGCKFRYTQTWEEGVLVNEETKEHLD